MSITATTIIQTEFGQFKINYHKISGKDFVSLSLGNVEAGNPVVRIHSTCLFGEAFHSTQCNCALQLTKAMKAIADNKGGVIVYSHCDEGRGVGLENKIKTMEIKRIEGISTSQALKKIGLVESDPNDYRFEVEVLGDLYISKTIVSFSNNSNKKKALESAGYVITGRLEVSSD
ncbi:MAG TPA: hypothetical protein VJC12_01700 [Candidatus Paceibacterota bacterium]